jgi:predicted Zn-dependent protease with MMP-like domain
MPSATTAPSLDDLIALADAALEAMPRELAEMARGVAIQVVDWPDDDTLAMMEIEDPLELTGLYWGVPFGEADGTAVREQPDMILLYRMPILFEWCETGVDLTELVRHVLIHEIGHHFGLSDEAMHALEAQVD